MLSCLKVAATGTAAVLCEMAPCLYPVPMIMDVTIMHAGVCMTMRSACYVIHARITPTSVRYAHV